jgi:glycosyltransferase involved in cell wall biosynthesis
MALTIARVSNVAARAFRRASRAGFKWPFRWTRMRARLAHRRGAIEPPQCDLLFVFHPLVTNGWILEGICKEIERHSGLTCRFFTPATLHQRGIPSARAYFVADYPVFADILSRNPILYLRPTLVFFWHALDFGHDEPRMLYALSQASTVVTMCSLYTDWLVDRGFNRSSLRMVIGGADESIFRPHPRGDAVIGFSAAFYPRKAPERVHAIIEAMPHRRFVLVGRQWERYARFEEMSRLPNLTVAQDVPYEEYPAYYAKMDVFVSASYQEGGPIPLIETMMCDIVPVASRTGFAPDIIEHGRNGFLFDTDAPIAEICALIEQALELRASVRDSVLDFTWREFTREIVSLLPPDLQARSLVGR